MHYKIMKFGSLYVGGLAVTVSKNNIPEFRQNSDFTIGHTITGKEISWVRPEGMNILIADRVIMRNTTWFDLNAKHFTGGRYVCIDGRWYKCRLLKVGYNPGDENEWDLAIRICGTSNSLWHWKGTYTIGQEIMMDTGGQNGYVSLRGGKRSPLDFRLSYEHNRTVNGCDIGFRPVLELLNQDPDFMGRDEYCGKIVTLEGQRFCLALPRGNSVDNDWDASTTAFESCGVKYPWGARGAGSWTNEKRLGGKVVLRGTATAGSDKPVISEFRCVEPDKAGNRIGFRPLLVPIDKQGKVNRSVLSGVGNGTILRAYSLTMRNKPVLSYQNPEITEYITGSDLTITDTFFGSEYLIRWVIFDGMAIANQNLVLGVSWDDLVRMGFADKNI